MKLTYITALLLVIGGFLFVEKGLNAAFLRIGDKVEISPKVVNMEMAFRGCRLTGIIVDRVEPIISKMNFQVKIDGCGEVYWYSTKYIRLRSNND